MAESNREEIAKLEALYANNPGGRVFTHLAEAYRKAGELDRARQILEDGITRHAEYASAHVVLGRVLQDQGALVEASGAFRRVLELDPENRVALRSLGDLAREGDQREEALAYFRQLLSLDPTDDQLVRIIDQLNAAIHAGEAEPLPTIEAEAAGPQAFHTSSGTQEPEFAESTPGSDASRTEEVAPAEDAAAAEQVSAEAEPAEAFRVESFVGVDPTEFHVEATPEDESPSAPTPQDIDPDGYVTADIRLDWDSEGVPQGEAPALPGDLAAFAEAESASLENVTPLEVTPIELGAPEPEPRDAEGTPEGSVLEDIDLHLPDETEQTADAVEDAMSAVGEMVDLGEELESAGHEPTFEELLSTTADAWKSLPEGKPSGLQAELQTETLAELYLSQGFNDRAAEVFRSLLERNPGDQRLQRRLADVEAKLAEAGAAEWGGEDADALDPFWTGGSEPASVEPTLYAWTEQEEPAGPTIGAFFGEVLSWRPSAGNGYSGKADAQVSAAEPDPADVPAPTDVIAPPLVPASNAAASSEAAASTEAAASDEAGASGGTPESAFAEVEPPAKEGGEPDTAFQEVKADVPGPGESAFEEVEAPRDTDAFVAQDSMAPLSTSGMLSQFSAPLNEVEAAFEEWFSGVPTQPKPSAGPAPSDALPSTVNAQPAPAPAAPDPNPGVSAPSAEAKPGGSSASSEDSEDDEDLEMFRSWLQSLKR